MDQNALLFKIVLEKVEHDLIYGKRKVVAEKANWTTITVLLRTRLTIAIEEDDYTSEIPSEVKA